MSAWSTGAGDQDKAPSLVDTGEGFLRCVCQDSCTWGESLGGAWRPACELAGERSVLSPRGALVRAAGASWCAASAWEYDAHRPRARVPACGAPFGSLVCTECQGTRSTAVDRCLAAVVFEDLPRVSSARTRTGENDGLAVEIAVLMHRRRARCGALGARRLRRASLGRGRPGASCPSRRRRTGGADSTTWRLSRCEAFCGCELPAAGRCAPEARLLGPAGIRARGAPGSARATRTRWWRTVGGVRVLLLDDVITTGASPVDAAAAALK